MEGRLSQMGNGWWGELFLVESASDIPTCGDLEGSPPDQVHDSSHEGSVLVEPTPHVDEEVGSSAAS